MHTVCNSTYFARAAAVRIKSKKKKCVIWNVAYKRKPYGETGEHKYKISTSDTMNTDHILTTGMGLGQDGSTHDFILVWVKC